MPGRVRAQVGRRVACRRRAVATVPLVEQNDAVPREVEQLEENRMEPGTRAPVEDDRRLVSVSACQPMEPVSLADVDEALHGRLSRAHRLSSIRDTTGSSTDAAKLSAPGANTFAPAGVS